MSASRGHYAGGRHQRRDYILTHIQPQGQDEVGKGNIINYLSNNQEYVVLLKLVQFKLVYVQNLVHIKGVVQITTRHNNQIKKTDE